MTEAKSNAHPSDDHPAVSVVIPTLNERSFIRDCLDSLVDQDYPELHEILVCDGGSTDGTRELVDSFGGLVRLVDNPGVTAAAGLNVGLSEMHGAVYCRGDAHTVYDRSFIRRSVEVLLETGATNVGGPMRAVGTTSFGRAVAAVTSSPFGVGPGRFHYAITRSDVDTVYLGCWWRNTLVDLGGWDQEDLQWGAEDQELNLRITERGGRVVLDPSIQSWYFPRADPRRLAKQYLNYGVCKASTLAKHRTLPSWRPLAPAALVAGTVAGAAFGRGLSRAAIPSAHTRSYAPAWRCEQVEKKVSHLIVPLP